MLQRTGVIGFAAGGVSDSPYPILLSNAAFISSC